MESNTGLNWDKVCLICPHVCLFFSRIIYFYFLSNTVGCVSTFYELEIRSITVESLYFVQL